MPEATVTSKGQITIPRPVRDRMGLKPGDHVECDQCGARQRSHQHVLADFLIGAHAVNHADRLVSRDRGCYATYFPKLVIFSGAA